jgi:predicted secreted hydrolase
MQRRALLMAAALSGAGPTQALPPRTLVFPRDHGSHPDFRTEWWYITGHAEADGRSVGFQVTFFRSRVDATQNLQSAFAAKQLLFAHAAVTDVQGKRLHHDQRIAREGFEVASAAQSDMRLRLRDWSLSRDGDRIGTRVKGNGFALDLSFETTQPLLLQGRDGLSRKGPDDKQASYYYSQPQLAVSGTVQLDGKTLTIAKADAGPTRNRAWLDHEWSDELLHPAAVGWDWIGMNMDDGSALTAFRLRNKDGGAVWDGGSFRHPTAGLFTFSRGEVIFQALRGWKSPISQATYPVEWLVRTPADFYTVKAIIDPQELDSRNSTGAIYWEGLSDLFDSNGRHAGRGYLEMTGYAKPLRL